MLRWLRGTLGVPLFLLALPLAAERDPVSIREDRGDGRIQLWVENHDAHATRWAWLELRGAQNILSHPALPLGLVLKPGEKRLAATLSPRSEREGYSYALNTRSGEGDPSKDPDPERIYLLPYAHGSKHTVTQGYFGRMTHAGLKALDFDLPEGTPVHAARDGVVTRVKQDSDRGGASTAFAKWGNSVEVMHDDGSWAVYAHLQKNGARVELGRTVKAGDLLGLSGSTGMANGPHLHFAVYKATWKEPIGIGTLFRTKPGIASNLEEGKTYYAYHPGGAEFKALLGAELDEAELRKLSRTARGGKFSFREEKVDQRVLIYGANGTSNDLDLVLRFAQQVGVRPSVGLPLRQRIPARTEAYLLYVDMVGPGRSAYQLSAELLPVKSPR